MSWAELTYCAAFALGERHFVLRYSVRCGMVVASYYNFRLCVLVSFGFFVVKVGMPQLLG